MILPPPKHIIVDFSTIPGDQPAEKIGNNHHPDMGNRLRMASNQRQGGKKKESAFYAPRNPAHTRRIHRHIRHLTDNILLAKWRVIQTIFLSALLRRLL